MPSSAADSKPDPKKPQTPDIPPFGSLNYTLSGKPFKGEPNDGSGQRSATEDLQGILDEHRDLYIDTWSKLDAAKPCCVYRHYDEDGVLIYVGITNDFPRRDNQHVERSRWRCMSKYVRIEKFPWAFVADAVEACAIQYEDPVYNLDRKAARGVFAISAKKLYKKSRSTMTGHVRWWIASPCREPWGPWSKGQR